MEWDKITNDWAAMTTRLRGEASEAPTTKSGPQDTDRPTTRAVADPSDTVSGETTGTDSSMQSNR